MPPAPKTSSDRSILSLFAVQAALTAFFGLVNSDSAHGPAVRAVAIAAAVLCVGVGLVLHFWPSSGTWVLAVGFEIAFIVTGVVVYAGWHVYMVGTIVAIANVARLSRARAVFAAPRAAMPGDGQPYVPPGYGQPGAAPEDTLMSHGQAPGMGQERYPGAAQSVRPDAPGAQHPPIRCAECGQQIAEGSQYCALCGAPVTGQRPAPAEPPAAAVADAMATSTRGSTAMANGFPKGPDIGDAQPARRRRIVLLTVAGVSVLAAVAVTAIALGISAVHKPAHGLVATLTDPPGTSANSVAFSPQGRTLATGDSQDSSTYLWDVATRHKIATLTDPGGSGVNSVAFSPDGHLLATGDADGSSYLWDVATRHRIATLTDPWSAGVTSVAFSPDGRTLAIGDGIGTSYLWDVATGHRIATLADPDGSSVRSVAFSPDGHLLATGDADGSSYLWNLATRHRIATLTDPRSDGVRSVAFSPDGHTLGTGDADGSSHLWNVATGHKIATFTDPRSDGVTSVAFSPDGQLLATGDGTGSSYLWNVATGHKIATRTGPDGSGGNSLAFSPDGRTLATCDQYGTIYLWGVS